MEITIDDVKDFIRKYGNIYDYEIQKELDKKRITKEEINKEISRNEKLYKELADL